MRDMTTQDDHDPRKLPVPRKEMVWPITMPTNVPSHMRRDQLDATEDCHAMATALTNEIERRSGKGGGGLVISTFGYCEGYDKGVVKNRKAIDVPFGEVGYRVNAAITFHNEMEAQIGIVRGVSDTLRMVCFKTRTGKHTARRLAWEMIKIVFRNTFTKTLPDVGRTA